MTRRETTDGINWPKVGGEVVWEAQREGNSSANDFHLPRSGKRSAPRVNVRLPHAGNIVPVNHGNDCAKCGKEQEKEDDSLKEIVAILSSLFESVKKFAPFGIFHLRPSEAWALPFSSLISYFS